MILIIGLGTPQASFAETPLKLIALTADWCAKCHVLEPAMARALEDTPPGTVRYVDIDLTRLVESREARAGLSAASQTRLRLHKAGWIWEDYEARTGLAWLIAADTGEPLSCFTSAVPAPQMAAHISQAIARVRSAAPGERIRSRPDCPGLVE